MIRFKERFAMKKTLSLCLTILILLTILPLSAFAEDTQLSEQEELINLACDAFPEYRDYILGNVSTYRGTSSDAEIIFCETRKISETEEITYAQYSNGRGIIVGSGIDVVSVGIYDPSQSNFAGGYDYTFSVRVATTDTTDFPGIFYVTGCKARIMSATYDSLINYGTCSVNNTNWCKYRTGGNNKTETSTQDACIEYNLTFLPVSSYGTTSSDDIHAPLVISVGGDDISATIR